MHETFMARIGARIKEFQRKMKQVDAAVKRTAMGTDKQIGADVSEFMRKAALVSAKARALARNKVIIPIEARTQRFQRVMSRIANTIHAFGTVAGNTFRGLGLMMSSTLVPIISTVIGLIGNLGVMIGTIGGSAFALATAFGAAGTAALAFGFAAAPTIKAVFGDIETLTEAQRKARDSFEDLKSTWQDVVKELEQPVLEAFNKAMQVANKVLEATTPMFKAAADAVNSLMDSLSKSVDSKPMQEFFNFLNKSAGPMLETIGKSIGNFVAGFMSMMTAFGPLAEETAKGFLNMSEGFATWAAQLSKSDKFQAFVSYISENMPKIRSIVGDAIVGIINTFAGFSGTASTMMTDLEGMMAKFREWSSSLASNDGFQKFLGYIVEVTPKVIDLVGNLITFIVNLGIALAPLGSKLLDIANGFIGWMNSMMQAHPIIGQIIAAMTVIVGALIAIVPWVAALRVAFSGLGTMLSSILSPVLGFIGRSISALVPIVTNIIAWVARLGTSLLTNGARMAAGWLIGMGPIGWITAAVIALVALIIWKWDEIKAFTIQIWSSVSQWLSNLWTSWVTTAATLLAPMISAISTIFNNTVNAGKQILQTFTNTLSTIWSNIKNIASNAWTIIKNAILGPILLLIDLATGDFAGFASHLSQIWSNIRNAAQQIWQSLKNIVVALVSGLVSSALTLIRTWASNFTTVLNGMKQTASNVFNAMRSVAISTVASLVSGVVSRFQSLVSSVASAMTNVYNKIKSIWNQAKSFLTNIDLTSVGKNIIQGLLRGIGSMAGAVKDKVASIASGIKSKITDALNIHSPSRWMRDMIGKNIGAGMIVGMDAMQSKVNAASTKLAQAAMVEPQRTSLAFDTSLSSSDFGRVQHDFGAQMDDFELPEPVTIVYNNVDKRGITSMVETQSARETRVQQGFSRKGG
jgi:phage-related protein